MRVKSKKHASGVTLVELMIASALSIAILAGMLHLMEGTSFTTRLNESLSNIHLTGHYTLDTLRGALKYRGFEGCKRPVSLDPRQESQINWDQGAEYTAVSASDFPLTNVAQESLRGYEVNASGTWSPPPDDADMIQLRNSVTPSPRPNSDVISVYYVSNDAGLVSTDMASVSDGIRVNDDTLTFEQRDLILIGDCTRSDIFAVSNSPGSTLPITLEHGVSVNDTTDLNYVYKVDAQVRKAYIDTFYIGDTGRKTEVGDEIYALYRYRNGETTELIEGVENLQVLYGEELSTGNIRYLTADNNNLNMRTVSVVQLGLLVYHHSSVTGEDDTRSYSLPGATVIAPSSDETAVSHLGGRYLRKVFTESIHMLNRS